MANYFHALIALFSLATLSAQTLPTTGTVVPELVKLDSIMQTLMSTYSVPGAALAVAHNGKLVFARGYGYADTTTQAQVQPDSLFRIASITKPYTAAAILKLIERGQLSLSDKAFTILSNLQPLPGSTVDPRVSQITIQNLLEHKSGWYGEADGTGYDPLFDVAHIAQVAGIASPADPATVIRYMLGRPLDKTPGTYYSYLNFGYLILGQIIQKVSGVNYEAFVTANVAGPIGDILTQFGATLTALPGEVTYYAYPGEGTAKSVFPTGPSQVQWPYGGFSVETNHANGGLVSTIIDILQFVSSINGSRGPQFFSTPVNGFPGYVPPYGAGWTYIFHGSLPGNNSSVTLLPDQTVVCWLTNTRPADSTSYFNDFDSNIKTYLQQVSNWPTGDMFPQFQKTFTIQTIPSGLQFSVDGGTLQTAPQTLALSQGTHTLAVSATQSGPAGTQYVFSNWSDGGAASHTISIGAASASFTAGFTTQYQLTTAANPAADGTVSPGSGAFYNAGTVVPLTATPYIGYSFVSWIGTVASTASASTTATMTGPLTVQGTFTINTTSQGTPKYLGVFISPAALGNSVIYQSGNTVAIGGTTSLGAMTLIGSAPSGDTAGMALYNSAGGGGASVSLDMYNTFANAGIPQAKIKALDDGAYSDHLTFWTKNPGAAANPVAERVRVTSTGRVGIGTPTPSAALEVVGNIKITGAGNGIIFPNGTTKSRGAVSGATGTRFGVNAVDVGERPGGVAFDGTAVWAVGGSGVTKVIAATGAKVGSYRTGQNPAEVVSDGFHVWVTNAGSGTVSKLLAATGALVGEYRVGTAPQGIAFDGDHVWVANSGSGDVTELMAETGAVMGTFRVGQQPTAVAFDGTNVWVTDASGGSVIKLLHGAVVGTYLVGKNPVGIAFDGENVWVANRGSKDVTKLVAATGDVVGTYAVGFGPGGIVFDGRDVWVSEDGIGFDGRGVWSSKAGNNKVLRIGR